MMGDQVDVAARVVDSGAGIMLDKTRLEAVDIATALKKLFTNSRYSFLFFTQSP
jgi:UDP:flavonoid glycosyltransferase YjiC (YdhE family)